MDRSRPRIACIQALHAMLITIATVKHRMPMRGFAPINSWSFASAIIKHTMNTSTIDHLP